MTCDFARGNDEIDYSWPHFKGLVSKTINILLTDTEI